MQPYTGHLVDMEGDVAKKLFEEAGTINYAKAASLGYVPVPDELAPAAAKKLAGRDEATVSLTSGGKLSKFAAKKRKQKRKTQKAARRNSR